MRFGGAARDLIGEARADRETERIADLRPIEPQDDDVVRGVFDQKLIWLGHDGVSRRSAD
jgi:hypothetical protein